MPWVVDSITGQRRYVNNGQPETGPDRPISELSQPTPQRPGPFPYPEGFTTPDPVGRERGISEALSVGSWKENYETWQQADEERFRKWYAKAAADKGLDPDPDAPSQTKNWRQVFKQGGWPTDDDRVFSPDGRRIPVKKAAVWPGVDEAAEKKPEKKPAEPEKKTPWQVEVTGDLWDLLHPEGRMHAGGRRDGDISLDDKKDDEPDKDKKKDPKSFAGRYEKFKADAARMRGTLAGKPGSLADFLEQLEIKKDASPSDVDYAKGLVSLLAGTAWGQSQEGWKEPLGGIMSGFGAAAAGVGGYLKEGPEALTNALEDVFTPATQMRHRGRTADNALDYLMPGPGGLPSVYKLLSDPKHVAGVTAGLKAFAENLAKPAPEQVLADQVLAEKGVQLSPRRRVAVDMFTDPLTVDDAGGLPHLAAILKGAVLGAPRAAMRLPRQLESAARTYADAERFGSDLAGVMARHPGTSQALLGAGIGGSEGYDPNNPWGFPLGALTGAAAVTAARNPGMVGELARGRMPTSERAVQEARVARAEQDVAEQAQAYSHATGTKVDLHDALRDVGLSPTSTDAEPIFAYQPPGTLKRRAEASPDIVGPLGTNFGSPGKAAYRRLQGAQSAYGQALDDLHLYGQRPSGATPGPFDNIVEEADAARAAREAADDVDDVPDETPDVPEEPTETPAPEPGRAAAAATWLREHPEAVAVGAKAALGGDDDDSGLALGAAAVLGGKTLSRAEAKVARAAVSSVMKRFRGNAMTGRDLLQIAGAAPSSPIDAWLRERWTAPVSRGEFATELQRSVLERDYRGMHTAPGREGAPLHDLTGAGTVYPDDIYSREAAQLYGDHGNAKRDRDSIAVIHQMKGKPDAMVTVYRAVPKDAPAVINPGDWVSINRQYAVDHGMGLGDTDDAARIVERKVRAADLFTNGDSIHEWGWEPPARAQHAQTIAAIKANFGKPAGPPTGPVRTEVGQQIVDEVIGSGVGSDHIHELYAPDPLDAVATNFNLNTVRDADIEYAREVLKQRSQEALRKTHGDTVTAYRGATGTEGKWETVSLTLDRGVAERHAAKWGLRPAKGVQEVTVKVDDVLGYSEAIGKGMFAEQEIVVPASVLPSPTAAPDLRAGSQFTAAIERQVLPSLQGSHISPDRVRKALAQAGVDPQELEARGITTWLDSAGTQPIPRADVVANLNSDSMTGVMAATPEVGGVPGERRGLGLLHTRTGTVMERFPGGAMTPKRARELVTEVLGKDEVRRQGLDTWFEEQKGPITRDALQQRLTDTEVKLTEKWLVENDAPPNETTYDDPWADDLNDAERETADVEQRKTEGRPFFSDEERGLVVPGGTNHRELLLIDPEVAKAGWSEPHWDEPGAIATGRFSDRVVNGANTLLSEETESWLHQQARRKGYTTVGGAPQARVEAAAAAEAAARPEFLERLHAIDAKFPRVNPDERPILFGRAFTDGSRESAEAIATQLHDPGGLTPRGRENLKTFAVSNLRRVWEMSNAEALAEVSALAEPTARYFDVSKELNAAQWLIKEGFPDAPLKGTDWLRALINRQLIAAAEEGKDAIAWLPGEVHSRRAAQQLDNFESLRLERTDDGFELTAKQRGEDAGEGSFRVTNRDDLERFVGKEHADRLWNADEVDGVREANVDPGLVVSSPGMRQHYDVNSPNIVNKFGQKYGVQAELVGMDVPAQEPRPVDVDVNEIDVDEVTGLEPPGYRYEIRGKVDGVETGDTDTFDTFREADAAATKLKRQLEYEEKKRAAAKQPVWFFRLTPEMRRDILQHGLTLGAAAALSSDEDDGAIGALGAMALGGKGKGKAAKAVSLMSHAKMARTAASVLDAAEDSARLYQIAEGFARSGDVEAVRAALAGESPEIQKAVQNHGSAIRALTERVATGLGKDPGEIKNGVGMLSTAVVTSAYPEAGSATKLRETNIDMLKDNPGGMESAAGRVKGYGLLTKAELRQNRSAEKVVQAGVAAMKRNLKAIYDAYPWKDRVKAWYLGSHRIAREMSDEFGARIEQVAGTLASLSPTKDWFMNIELGKRIFSRVEEFKKTNPVFSEKLFGHYVSSMDEATEEGIKAARRDSKKAKAARTDREAQAAAEAARAEAVREGKKGKAVKTAAEAASAEVLARKEWTPEDEQVFQDTRVSKIRASRAADIEQTRKLVGQSWQDTSLAGKAFIFRTSEIADFPDGQHFRAVSPEGDLLDKVRNLDGNPTLLIHQSYDNIQNAIHIAMLDPADMGHVLEQISETLGSEHKVRSFYNNIIHPWDRRSVTIDTHAVGAALLRPVGTTSGPVKDSMGGTPSSSVSGMSGMNAVFGEAYFDLARELKIRPSELQSITWEGIRSMFEQWQKAEGSAPYAAVKALHNQYIDGSITHEQLFQGIKKHLHDTAGKKGRTEDGWIIPSWVEHGVTDKGRMVAASVSPGDAVFSSRPRGEGEDSKGLAGARAAQPDGTIFGRLTPEPDDAPPKPLWKLPPEKPPKKPKGGGPEGGGGAAPAALADEGEVLAADEADVLDEGEPLPEREPVPEEDGPGDDYEDGFEDDNAPEESEETTAAAPEGPRTIRFIRSTGGAPDVGETMGQHLEPTGRYMTEADPSDDPSRPLEQGWERGEVTFQKPLVIDFGANDYQDPSNWKAVLSERYDGKTGRALSEAVKADGYDGIITMKGKDTSEIVDLTKPSGPGVWSDVALSSIQRKVVRESNYRLGLFELRGRRDGSVEIETMAVKAGHDNGGVGTKAMQTLTQWADEQGVRLVLSPSQRGYQPIADGVKTTSTTRLKNFYKRFGFVDPTSAKHYDPTLSSPTRPVMYRNPKAPPSSPPDAGPTPSFRGVEAPVFKGADLKRNAVREREKHLEKWRRWTTEPTEDALRVTEAELRALPLVHGTTVSGALGATKDGLLSRRAFKSQKAAQYAADIKTLREQILEKVQQNTDKTQPRSLHESLLDVAVDEEWFADTLADEFDIDRQTAEALYDELQNLRDVSRVFEGKSFAADEALGLDQFVFMTHGRKHQDYGNVGVIIDNTVLRDSFSTDKDIVLFPGASTQDPETGNPVRYSKERVRAYRDSMLEGEDYYAVAAAKAGSPEAVRARERAELFEVKTPHVPASAVKGFFVEADEAAALRLSDQLAKKGDARQVLYVEEMWSPEVKRFVHEQLKHLQTTGGWDTAAYEAFRDAHDGSGVYLLP